MTLKGSTADHAALLVYATRYALGRHTYAVSDVCDLIDANHELLREHPNIRTAIIRDIREHDDAHPFSESDVDGRRWLETLRQLETL